MDELVGMLGDIVSDPGWTYTLKAARERVVVKRPDYAPWLDGRKPTLAFETRKNRKSAQVKDEMSGRVI